MKVQTHGAKTARCRRPGPLFVRTGLGRGAVALLLLLALLVSADVAPALALSLRVSLDDLALGAELAVRARVVSVTSDWDAAHRLIETTNVLEVLYPIKGEASAPLLVVKTRGGRVGQKGLWVSDEPSFQPDDEVVVFLRRDESTVLRVVEAEQGQFDVHAGQVTNRAWLTHEPVGDFLDKVEGTLLKLGIKPTLPARTERQSIEAGRPSGRTWTETMMSSLGLEGLYHALAGDVSTMSYHYNGYKWPGPDPMGEVYKINANTADIGPDHGSKTDFINAIEAAGQVWNDVAEAHFDYTYGGETTITPQHDDPAYDGINAIYWVPHMKNNSVLGTSWYWYYGSTIDEADIELNDSYTWDVNPTPGSREMDVESVLMHEMGHWLSLGHDTDSDAVMYDTYLMGSFRRVLAASDRAGIAYIYPEPAPPPITVTLTPIIYLPHVVRNP